MAKKPARRQKSARDAPTLDQRKRLRGLLTSAGSVVELHRWIKRVQQQPKGTPGRKAQEIKEIDERYLDGMQLECLLALARGERPTTALRKTFERIASDKGYRMIQKFGASADAVARRFYRKLKTRPLSEANLQIARQAGLTEDQIARFMRELRGKRGI